MNGHTVFAILALLAVIGLSLADRREHARQRRAFARERDLILNQLLHATGNTWTPPPADQPAPPTPPAEPAEVRWTATPEQFPT